MWVFIHRSAASSAVSCSFRSMGALGLGLRPAGEGGGGIGMEEILNFSFSGADLRSCLF